MTHVLLYGDELFKDEVNLRGKVKDKLQVASYEFRYTSYEFKPTSYKFKSMSYEFKSTS